MLAGIFVGGASRRMGRPKGLLPAPEGSRERAPESTAGAPSLVARWAALCAELAVPVVLVGRRPEYAELARELGLETLDDARADAGPLAGLVALLERAGGGDVLALACDMPFVTREDLRALIDAPACAVAAPRRDGRWEPLCTRYHAPSVLPIAQARLRDGDRKLQGLLDALDARAIPIEPSHLRDWDRPEDLR